MACSILHRSNQAKSGDDVAGLLHPQHCHVQGQWPEEPQQQCQERQDVRGKGNPFQFQAFVGAFHVCPETDEYVRRGWR
jgi:hypothetical protein